MAKKKADRNVFLVIAVILVVLIGTAIVFTNPFPQTRIEISSEEGIEVGKKLPQIAFTDSQGMEVGFSDYAGQNLIINSWAAWCPFCINEMPDLQKASDENDDVTILFIHRTKTEPFSAGERFLNEFAEEGTPITDPILLDPDDSFYATFFGFGMPVSMFVDKEGIIKFKKVGPMDLNEVRDNIEKHFRTSAASVDQNGGEIQTLPDGTKFLVHPSNILSGGPPKGGIGVDIGIAALAEGQGNFIPAEEADFLSDDELVLGLYFEGKARAYPHQILVFHEIVNDKINEKPIVVTYCPLCLTGIAFERKIGDLEPQFGTSGKLYNSNLVMYDDATDSYWYQQTGQAIVGELTGTKLKWIPLDTVKWGDWKKQHPDTDVLSRETGFARPYGSDPYGGYYTSTYVGYGASFTDDRLHPKAWIHGIVINEKAKAYPRDEVEKVGLINDNFEVVSILVVQDPVTKAVRIFDRTVEGEILEFEIRDGKLFDNMGTEWDFEGKSDGKELSRIPDHFGFWFSWTLANPGTDLFEA